MTHTIAACETDTDILNDLDEIFGDVDIVVIRIEARNMLPLISMIDVQHSDIGPDSDEAINDNLYWKVFTHES